MLRPAIVTTLVTAATVVAMPSYSDFSFVASRTFLLAKRTAVFRRLPS